MRALLLLALVGCGSVSSLQADSGQGDAGGRGGSVADASAELAGAGGGGGSAGAAGTSGGAGSSGGGAGGGCVPAVVKLTAGDVTCACGGTCAPCPTADGPTCGGTGLGHPNWSGCTVGGAPYSGCAAGTFNGAPTIGICCRNNCSDALCQP